MPVSSCGYFANSALHGLSLLARRRAVVSRVFGGKHPLGCTLRGPQSRSALAPHPLGVTTAEEAEACTVRRTSAEARGAGDARRATRPAPSRVVLFSVAANGLTARRGKAGTEARSPKLRDPSCVRANTVVDTVTLRIATDYCATCGNYA